MDWTTECEVKDTAVGDVVTCQCKEKYNYKSGNYSRNCELGASWSGDYLICQGICSADTKQM